MQSGEGETDLSGSPREGKELHELTVFVEFARAAGLTLDTGSVEARQPQEPDIHCSIQGVPRYFELGRLLDSETPKLRLEAIRKHPQQVRVDRGKFGLPERDVLRKKLRKRYKTGGQPVELVLYYDWGPDAFLVASSPPPIDLPSFIADVVMPELAREPGPFDVIWIYERTRPSVLWRHQQSRQ